MGIFNLDSSEMFRSTREVLQAKRHEMRTSPEELEEEG